MAWATIADVLAITGEVVEQSAVDQATVLIELYCGRTQEDLPTPTGRDGRWLRIAVAYQAVEQARGGSVGEIQSLSIDGLNVGLKTGQTSEGPGSLSKLAWRALRNLSWMRLQGQKVGIGHERATEYVHESIAFDEDEPGSVWTNWRPI